MKRPAVLDPLHQKLATYAAREHDDTFFNLYRHAEGYRGFVSTMKKRRTAAIVSPAPSCIVIELALRAERVADEFRVDRDRAAVERARPMIAAVPAFDAAIEALFTCGEAVLDPPEFSECHGTVDSTVGREFSLQSHAEGSVCATFEVSQASQDWLWEGVADSADASFEKLLENCTNLYATRRRKIELAIERADRALAVLKAQ